MQRGASPSTSIACASGYRTSICSSLNVSHCSRRGCKSRRIRSPFQHRQSPRSKRRCKSSKHEQRSNKLAGRRRVVRRSVLAKRSMSLTARSQHNQRYCPNTICEPPSCRERRMRLRAVWRRCAGKSCAARTRGAPHPRVWKLPKPNWLRRAIKPVSAKLIHTDSMNGMKPLSSR